MANEDHLNILRQGVEVWNNWTNQTVLPKIDLSGANLSGLNLSAIQFTQANLSEANLDATTLSGAYLSYSDLSSASLIGTKLDNAHLTEANLKRANLVNANLVRADIRGTDCSGTSFWNTNLREADLRGANLSKAQIIETNLQGADLSGAVLVETNFVYSQLDNCRIWGIAARHVNLLKTTQTNLIISQRDEPIITIDGFQAAQFMYLLLHYPEVANLVDTMTTKIALIFGRFSGEHILHALQGELRKRYYAPMIFKIDDPPNRDLTSTITALVRMAQFIIVDISEPDCLPKELASIVFGSPSITIQPIISTSSSGQPIFGNGEQYPWFLPIYRYSSPEILLSALSDKVVQPVVEKAKKLRYPR